MAALVVDTRPLNIQELRAESRVVSQQRQVTDKIGQLPHDHLRGGRFTQHGIAYAGQLLDVDGECQPPHSSGCGNGR